MSVDNSIIKKIQKLIALAGNNPNEHERARAMEKATELLAQHNLTESQVMQKYHDVVLHQVQSINSQPWIRAVFQAVDCLYFTKTLYGKEGKDSAWHPILVGTPENCQVAESIARWLIKIIRKQAKSFADDSGLQKSFSYGAAIQVWKNAERIRQQQLNTQGSTGTSLMVLRNSLEKQNQDYIDSLNVKNKVTQRKTTNDALAYLYGQAYGNSINLSRQLPQSKELIK